MIFFFALPFLLHEALSAQCSYVAYNSLFVHIDSCDVYGEVNSNDIFALVELLTCTFTAISYSATLNDIPDEGLRSGATCLIRLTTRLITITWSTVILPGRGKV